MNKSIVSFEHIENAPEKTIKLNMEITREGFYDLYKIVRDGISLQNSVFPQGASEDMKQLETELAKLIQHH